MPKIVDKNIKFYCKYPNCHYNDTQTESYFTKRKYLNQHVDKVHAEKVLDCAKCGKSFSTASLLKTHAKACGEKFICSCDAVYTSREALLTHAKRKSHVLPVSKKNNDSNVQPLLMAVPVVILQPTSSSGPLSSTTTQTDQHSLSHTCSMHVMAAVALSELARGSSHTTTKNNVSTQTSGSTDVWSTMVEGEYRLISSGTQVEVDAGPRPSSPWLGSSIETQTTDEDFLLRPLNLCDIETQTPWTELGDAESQTFSSFLEEFWDPDLRKRVNKQDK